MIRRIIGVLAGTLAVAALAAAGLLAWAQADNQPLIYESPAQVAARPVALVFGGGIYADGSLTPMLRDRVDTAIALYRAGKVRKLLMSGDNRVIEYDEPGRMYDYAVSQGMPAADIVRDYAGLRTYDSCYRAGAIFGVRGAVLVTQRFHLVRALYTCRALGMDAVGVVADRQPYGGESYYELREAAAILAAWLDVNLIRPQPVLGDRIDLGL